MTFDIIFSPKAEALFHGDPHAGNVFHVTDNSKDAYQIALLDWGLRGTFPRQERDALVQLILGVKLRDAKRLRNYVGALLEGGLPDSAEKLARIDAIIARVLKPKTRRSTFEAIEELLLALIQEGYQTRFNLNLFVKSQVTIAGILAELDPTLKQDDYLAKRLSGLVKRELPKRLLYTLWFPAWNSRRYRSLLSNRDVKDFILNKPNDKKLAHDDTRRDTGHSQSSSLSRFRILSKNGTLWCFADLHSIVREESFSFRLATSSAIRRTPTYCCPHAGDAVTRSEACFG